MRLIFILCVLMLCGPWLHAQELVNGIVADSATFAPVPYVNVVIKHKNKGTITDDRGNFRLVVVPDDTLVFSFVGYNTLELPVNDWQASIILLSERSTILNTITIEDRRRTPYEGVFDDQHAEWIEQNRKLPFYYTRAKKQKIRVNRLQNENERVKTYVDVVIRNEETRKTIMERFKLDEKSYYDILAVFNMKHHTVMYYLSAPELLSLLNYHFAEYAGKR